MDGHGAGLASVIAPSRASPYRRPLHAPLRQDPLVFILGPGERWDVVTIALGVAFALHVAALIFAVIVSLLAQLRPIVQENQAKLHEFFWREYDVEIVKKPDPTPEQKPEEPPPPPPEPEPAPVPKAQPKPVDDDPYKNIAPTPAKAAKVLTAEPKADEPVELPTIVSGDGNALGGVQSADGKGDTITQRRDARNDGVPGGRGTQAAPAPPPPPPGPDLSRPVGLTGSASWNCPFPPEADAEQIDQAVVGVQITVRPDGSASSATVVSDPGHGFGRAAKACALARRYQPALDRTGTPIVGSNLVNVRFSR